MQTNRLLVLASAAAISAYSSVAVSADVVIGVPNWPSVQATAHILKIAIEDNLDLEVELQAGSNTAVFNAMDAGTIHVHPEAWMPNLAHLKRQYVDGKKSIKMTPSGASGTQQMCVTKGTAERTGIKELKISILMGMAKGTSGSVLQDGGLHPLSEFEHEPMAMMPR